VRDSDGWFGGDDDSLRVQSGRVLWTTDVFSLCAAEPTCR
jgi:hypothetical protein